MEYTCQEIGSNIVYACDDPFGIARPLYETAAQLEYVPEESANNLDKGLRLFGELLTNYWVLYLVALVVILVLLSLSIWIATWDIDSGYPILGGVAICLIVLGISILMSSQFDQNWAAARSEYSDYTCENTPWQWTFGVFMGNCAGFCAAILAWGGLLKAVDLYVW